MRKKILTLTLAMAMCLVGLTACGKDESSDDKTTAAANDVTEEVTTEAATEEVTEAAPAGQEITYAADIYGKQFNITIVVPEGSNYEFTDTKPFDNTNIDGGLYLKSDKVVAAINTDSYSRYGDSTSTTFADFSTYMKSGSRPIVGDTVIGGKEALQLEYKWGEGSGDRHGYRYFIDASDVLGEGKMVEISFFPADLSVENVESTFSDTEVQDVISSITFSN